MEYAAPYHYIRIGRIFQLANSSRAGKGLTTRQPVWQCASLGHLARHHFRTSRPAKCRGSLINSKAKRARDRRLSKAKLRSMRRGQQTPDQRAAKRGTLAGLSI